MHNLKKLYKQQLKSIKGILPRKFHLYCVGAAKTGSTSIASMFSSSYRVAHEPEVTKTNQLVINWLENKIEQLALEKNLIERDNRLKLELESSHPLGYITDILASIFPDAMFIVTIREPYSWLKSRLNFHYKVDPPAWKIYRQYFWTNNHQEYAPQEAILERFGLYSLDTYLSQYSDHYKRVFNNIPQDRFVIIKTSEINQSIPVIANFIGIKESNIKTAHSKKSTNKIEPLKKIDSQFVRTKIWHHCQDIIVKYFPECTSEYQ